jgi:hypothetical protein
MLSLGASAALAALVANVARPEEPSVLAPSMSDVGVLLAVSDAAAPGPQDPMDLGEGGDDETDDDTPAETELHEAALKALGANPSMGVKNLCRLVKGTPGLAGVQTETIRDILTNLRDARHTADELLTGAVHTCSPRSRPVSQLI